MHVVDSGHLLASNSRPRHTEHLLVSKLIINKLVKCTVYIIESSAMRLYPMEICICNSSKRVEDQRILMKFCMIGLEKLLIGSKLDNWSALIVKKIVESRLG